MGHSTNRESACSFLNTVVAGNVREAYDKFVSQDFIHHNAHFKGDRESLLLAMEEDATKNPNKKLEIKLTLVDRDFVTTYSHIQHKPEDIGIAAAHIFRFENSKIVELWDVAIFIPEDSPNENGMF
ncbi:MAG: ester cyclase [Candidatus Thorarchaeota archaeon]